MNMVARAVAKQQLDRAVVDQKIALYSTQDGDTDLGVVVGVAVTFHTVVLACEIDKLNTPDVRVLKGSLSACQQIIELGRYDTQQTSSLVLGLDKARLLAAQVKPKSLDLAIRKLLIPSL